MALSSLKPSWSGESAEYSTDAEFKLDSRKSTRQWTATCDAPATDNCESIKQQSNLALRQSLPGDAYRRMNSLSIERKAPILFVLRATFVAEGSKAGDNPLDKPMLVTENYVEVEEQIDEDFDGKAICTINGEGYDPPLTHTFYDYEITIKKNVADWDRVAGGRYIGAVDSDGFLGFEAGQSKMVALGASEVDADDYVYFELSATIRVRFPAATTPKEKTWWKRIRHEGFMVKLADGSIVHAREILADGTLGDLVQKPVLLKQDGTRETNPDSAYWYFVRPPRMLSLPFNDLF